MGILPLSDSNSWWSSDSLLNHYCTTINSSILRERERESGQASHMTCGYCWKCNRTHTDSEWLTAQQRTSNYTSQQCFIFNTSPIPRHLHSIFFLLVFISCSSPLTAFLKRANVRTNCRKLILSTDTVVSRLMEQTHYHYYLFNLFTYIFIYWFYLFICFYDLQDSTHCIRPTFKLCSNTVPAIPPIPSWTCGMHVHAVQHYLAGIQLVQ